MRHCAAAYQNRGRADLFLLGPEATLERLRQALALKPSVLHFATHVVPSADNARTGNLVLSLRPDGTPELLNPRTIAALGAHPELVVMSGCASGSGPVLPGEGLMGLTRAWLRAGAHNVLATLWPTPDDAGELLRSFYRRLGSDGRFQPRQALRLAQLDMLRSQTWRSGSRYWAAFFLVSRN